MCCVRNISSTALENAPLLWTARLSLEFHAIWSRWELPILAILLNYNLTIKAPYSSLQNFGRSSKFTLFPMVYMENSMCLVFLSTNFSYSACSYLYLLGLASRGVRRTSSSPTKTCKGQTKKQEELFRNGTSCGRGRGSSIRGSLRPLLIGQKNTLPATIRI